MNFETYLTETIQEVVRKTIKDELEKLKEDIVHTIKSRNKRIQRDIKNKIIRPGELAEMLSVSTVTVWRMEKKGELPSRFKISNRAVGWLRSDIEEWLAEKKES